ncbi:ABC transporter ATP-binding protein [Virgisporangium aurantiacum]|uniref:ABC transporter ATP-binding protein n=1 Tax=Virgisporangium aurantiacum TaxID=175570 RepID=A0A8J4E2K2_9ACTN|nr:ABC transporter ATP-binding protein [Virgisporangium aurantiacum]
MLGAATLAGTLATLGLPTVLGRTVDALVAGAPSGGWIALVAGLIAVGIASDLAETYASAVSVAGTTAWLRERLVRHVLAVSPDASRRFGAGDLVSRVSGNAAEAAQAGVGVVSAVASVLPPLGSLLLLAYIDPRLAVAFLAGAALCGVVLRAFARRTAAVVTDYQRTQGLIAGRLAESLSGRRTVAAAGTLDRERNRVLEPLADLHAQGRRMWAVLARSVAEATVAGPLVLVSVLATGGLLLVDRQISAGELFAAGQYAVIGAGLGSLTGIFARLARARAGSRRVGEVFAVGPVRYGVRDLPDGPGRLEFRGVTVRAGDTVLLAAVDLDLPGGAAVAVVGRSGAGKSVLAGLAARLRDPDHGTVRLDGTPLTDLSHAALRRAVGCAFERPVLVGTAVADAIGPAVDRRRVRAAARATHAHEFVSRLPLGYDTPLTEVPLSGGELQRLGLARAWPADRLLVLDDATSSLDMVTEMQIGHTLTDDHRGRTRLIVTHRAATAARADLVVWLCDGRVRAVGPHAELWRRPAYRAVFAAAEPSGESVP